jgi:hypothetical protein
MRLFVPLVYSADWFLYLDDDILGSRDWFPEIERFTTNLHKTLFSVIDPNIAGSPRWEVYFQMLERPELFSVYFGSGFLLMRSGAILRTQLRNVLRFVPKHMNLTWPDQDALNIAWNRSQVQILPWQYCIVGYQIRTQQVMGAYLKHYANKRYYNITRKLTCFAVPYYTLYNQSRQNGMKITNPGQYFQHSDYCP